MHAGQTRAEQRLHVERAGGIAAVEMGEQPLAVAGAQFGKESRFVGRARAVIERVAAADFRKPRRHRISGVMPMPPAIRTLTSPAS